MRIPKLLQIHRESASHIRANSKLLEKRFAFAEQPPSLTPP